MVAGAIRSILNQNYPNLELIIADDNSDEKTKKVIHDLIDGRKDVLFFSSSVKMEDRANCTRYSIMINKAYDYCTGNLVGYLTDDDIQLPGYLFEFNKLFLDNAEINVACCRQNLVHAEIVTGRLQRKQVAIRGVPYWKIGEHRGGIIDHNQLVHRRECLDVLFEKFNRTLWDESEPAHGAADCVFHAKLSKYFEFWPLDQILVEHRFHPKSIQSISMKGLYNRAFLEEDLIKQFEYRE